MSILYDMRSGTLVKSKLYNNGILLKDILNKDKLIEELFAGDGQGVWYDPSDKSTLFQDVEGTIPVVNDGDPVSLMLDKSGNGNHATQTVSAARPVYKTDGFLHWLEFDGVDDVLASTLASIEQPYSVVIAKDESMVFGANTTYVDSPSSSTQVRRYGGNYYAWTIDGKGGLATQLQSPAKCVMSLNVDGLNSSIRFNDTSYPKESGTGAIAGETTIFKYTGGTSPTKAVMYGFIIAQNIVSNNVDMIHTYLAAKSGVTL